MSAGVNREIPDKIRARQKFWCGDGLASSPEIVVELDGAILKTNDDVVFLVGFFSGKKKKKLILSPNQP